MPKIGLHNPLRATKKKPKRRVWQLRWYGERIDVKPLTAYPVLGKETVSLGFDVFRLISTQEWAQDEYKAQRAWVCGLHRAFSPIKVVRVPYLEVHGFVLTKCLLANAIDVIFHHASPSCGLAPNGDHYIWWLEVRGVEIVPRKSGFGRTNSFEKLVRACRE